MSPFLKLTSLELRAWKSYWAAASSTSDSGGKGGDRGVGVDGVMGIIHNVLHIPDMQCQDNYTDCATASVLPCHEHLVIQFSNIESSFPLVPSEYPIMQVQRSLRTVQYGRDSAD